MHSKATGLTTCLAAAMFIFVGTAQAADDPITVRQGMMKNVGKAMGAAAAMIKGQAEFDPRVAELAFRTMNAAALGFGEMFPEGSDAGAKNEAAPAIWQDQAGFLNAVAKFQSDTAAAVNPAPTDIDGFKATFGKVAGNCKACHESYRIKKQ